MGGHFFTHQGVLTQPCAHFRHRATTFRLFIFLAGVALFFEFIPFFLVFIIILGGLRNRKLWFTCLLGEATGSSKLALACSLDSFFFSRMFLPLFVVLAVLFAREKEQKKKRNPREVTARSPLTRRCLILALSAS